MTDYRRFYIPGSTWFFTVNLANRRDNRLLVEQIDFLREAFRYAHLLTGQDDFNVHFDYIHWNPIKHGWTQRVADWPHSSLYRFLELVVYPFNWGYSGDFNIQPDKYLE